MSYSISWEKEGLDGLGCFAVRTSQFALRSSHFAVRTSQFALRSSHFAVRASHFAVHGGSDGHVVWLAEISACANERACEGGKPITACVSHRVYTKAKVYSLHVYTKLEIIGQQWKGLANQTNGAMTERAEEIEANSQGRARLHVALALALDRSKLSR